MKIFYLKKEDIAEIPEVLPFHQENNEILQIGTGRLVDGTSHRILIQFVDDVEKEIFMNQLDHGVKNLQDVVVSGWRTYQ